MMFTIEFRGGFRDGERIMGDDDPRKGDTPICGYLFLTEGGRVGARFRDPFPIEAVAQDEEYVRATEEVKKTGRMLTSEQYEYFRKKFEKCHVYEIAERRMASGGISIVALFVGEEAW